jgi:hypothetical protein
MGIWCERSWRLVRWSLMGLALSVGCQTQKPVPPTLAPVPEALGSPDATRSNTGHGLPPGLPNSQSHIPANRQAQSASGVSTVGPPGSGTSTATAPWRRADDAQMTSGRPGVSRANPTGESFTSLKQRAESVYHRLVRTQGATVPRLVVTAEARPRISTKTAGQLVISSGLVQQCPSDDALAGVLALTLAETMTRTPAPTVEPVQEPLDLRIGPESNTYGELPLLRQAELVKTGQANRGQPARRQANVDTLARQIYSRAGFAATEFGQARILYQQAVRD